MVDLCLMERDRVADIRQGGILQHQGDVERRLGPAGGGPAFGRLAQKQLDHGAVDVGPTDGALDGDVAGAQFGGVPLSDFVERLDVRKHLHMHVLNAADGEQLVGFKNALSGFPLGSRRRGEADRAVGAGENIGVYHC
ncbi:hypothetical protein DESC_780036 [Desulfosarcina cetonica]|nr:hypothetical protein DESC_780036 [Desulfosarcina cetonica]